VGRPFWDNSVSCSLSGSHLPQCFVLSGEVCNPYSEPGDATHRSAAILELMANGRPRPIGNLPMCFGKFSGRSSIHRKYWESFSACSRRGPARRTLFGCEQEVG
jgi:hypothetical protein